MIAFHYPPIGGAGVQRNVQLVRRLKEHGYRPVVVTGQGVPDYRWTPSDGSLIGDETIAIHRLEGREPPYGTPWESRLERWARIPTRWQRWWSSNLLRQAPSWSREVDLVRVSLAPFSVGPAAVELARVLGKPLVLDLEDPWALDEMLVYPTRAHRWLELRKMRRVLGAADAVVMNTREAMHRMIHAFPELADRARAIPNAFDPADFDVPTAARPARRFRIVHTGSLHLDLGVRHREASVARRILGGAVGGVDFLTRSHVFLVEALELLFAARPDLRDEVELHFAGVLTPAEQQSLEGVGIATLHGFLNHRETTALVRTADLLFLPMHDLPEGHRATIVPQKTYEYLGSGRPILAAVPDGDARDLLEAAGNVRLARPSDTRAIANLVGLEIDRWRTGAEPTPPRHDVQIRSSAPRLVADMAGLFDELIS